MEYMNIACYFSTEVKTKLIEITNVLIKSFHFKNKTLTVKQIKIVVTTSFLSKIIEPNGYTTTSSLNKFIRTYINLQNQ